MKIQGGTLEFEGIFSNEKIIQSLKELQRHIQGAETQFVGASKSINASLTTIPDSIKKIGAMVGVGFGINELKNFAMQVVNVRGQLQMMEQSFNVLTGSEERAAAMLKEIRDIALKSPLTLTDVSSGAQTLLSFNIEAEKVIPIVKQLGDISMGNSQRFNSLALAFAQMSSAGRLMGQDLLQMINAGFNPLSIMSEKTGKSIAVLKKEMSDGAISSEMVADAFRQATEEGGKFHGMMEAQAQGIVGLQASLSDAFTNMFNKIGSDSEGFIVKTYQGLTSLVENYEELGRAIASLVVAYGAYKAALITANALQVVNERLLVQQALAGTTLTTSQKLGTLATLSWQKAQALLNKTMLANPYVLVGAAVAALAVGIFQLATADSAAEIAQKSLNKSLGEAKEKKDDLISKTNDYIRIIQDETQSIYQQKLAYEQLKKAMPEFAKYSQREIATMSPEQFGKLINFSADRQEVEDYAKELANLERILAQIRKGDMDAEDEGAELLGVGFWRGINKTEDVLEKRIKLMRDEQAEREKLERQAAIETEYNKKTAAQKIEQHQSELAALEQQRAELEAQIPAYDAITGKMLDVKDGIFQVNEEWKGFDLLTYTHIGLVEGLREKIAALKGKITELQTDDSAGQTYKDARAAALQALKDARKAVEDAKKGTKAEYDKKTAALQAAEKNAKALGIDTSKKSGKDTFKEELEKKKKQYDDYFKWVNAGMKVQADKEYSSLLESGKNYTEYLKKLLESSKLSKAQIKTVLNEIAAAGEVDVFKKFTENLESALDKTKDLSETAKILVNFRSLIGSDDAQGDKKLKFIDEQQIALLKKADEELRNAIDKYREYNDSKLTDEEKYYKKRKTLQEEYEKTTDEKSKEIIAKQIEALDYIYSEQVEINYDKLVQDYGTFVQKKEKLETEFNKKISVAREQNDLKLAENLKIQLSKNIIEIFEQKNEYIKFFNNIEFLSKDVAKNIHDALKEQLEKLLEEGKITLQDYKNAVSRLNDNMGAANSGKQNYSGFKMSDWAGAGGNDIMKNLESMSQYYEKMGNSMNSMGQDGSKMLQNAKGMQGAASKVTNVIAIIDAIVTAIYNGIKATAEIQEALFEGTKKEKTEFYKTAKERMDIASQFNETAMEGWQRLKNGDVMGAMASTIKSYTQLIKNIKNWGLDRKIADAAQKLADKTLEAQALSYEENGKYSKELELIRQRRAINLQEQKILVQAQLAAEQSKKNGGDDDTMREYKSRLLSLDNEIEEMKASAADAIFGEDIATAIDNFANAYADAWAKGENRAKSAKQVVVDMIKAMVMEMIKADIAAPVEALRAAMKAMYADGVLAGEERKALEEQAAQIANEIKNKYDWADRFMKDADTDLSTLSGAIKGASQESIDLLAGQTNAVRINQIESIELLRQQLLYLFFIGAKIGAANDILTSIDDKLTQRNELRAMGVTNL
ncbi:MAG: tape measure protein [Prevotellaceae bacterium]|jgi:tape measure domain-containing protein|nr:tape measure protein [Prevotellaceae bacterium]